VSPATPAAPHELPPATVPFPVAPSYQVRPDLVRLGQLPVHVDDSGAATLLRLDDGAPAALAHALRELAEAPEAVRWADPEVGFERWWDIASSVAHALAADGDPRVGLVDARGPTKGAQVGVAPAPETGRSSGIALPWLGLRLSPDGALERGGSDPRTPRELADLAGPAVDALQRLPAATRALDALRLSIAEDLVVLLRDRRGDGGRAGYLCVAAPSGWDPGARGNASFAALHAPVPRAGPLLSAGAAIADAMVEKGPFVRYVWSLAADDAPSHHPRRHPAARLDGRDPATWWLRVERQTTLPLPGANAAAFFIRVLHRPLPQAVGPAGRRARLAAAVRSMDPALLAYKGLAGAAPALLRWLERDQAP
jgi:hypothetical protein